MNSALETDSKAGKQQKHEKRPKIPKKISETYLHNAGLYYLQRFAASKAHFRSVMLRKVKRSCLHHPDQDYEDCAALVDVLADKFEKTGLLDDEAYIRGMVTSLRRRGLSQKAISAKLYAKGVPSDLSIKALALHDSEVHDDPAQAEKLAALIFCRRKKLGPFALNDKKTYDQFMGSLARSGFSFDTARFVLSLNLGEAEDLQILET